MGRLFTDGRGRQQKGNELEFLLGPNFPKAPVTLYQGWMACSSCISEGRVRKMLEEINPGNKAVERAVWRAESQLTRLQQENKGRK